ncbi:hypothetical protein JCM10213_004477 [Rhodosporidiobolus nylandii]
MLGYTLISTTRALPSSRIAVAVAASRTFASTAFALKHKPTEHEGQKLDGGKDQRMDSSHGLGGDSARASSEGQKGGKTGGKASVHPADPAASPKTSSSGYGSSYRPSEHDGKRKDGQPDGRTKSSHGFGGDRERAKKLGSEGGKH